MVFDNDDEKPNEIIWSLRLQNMFFLLYVCVAYNWSTIPPPPLLTSMVGSVSKNTFSDSMLGWALNIPTTCPREDGDWSPILQLQRIASFLRLRRD